MASTWPLPRHLATHLPHDLGDPLLITYLLNWNARVVPLTEAWWSPPFFWPEQDMMTLSEHVLGMSIAATPLQMLGVPPVAAYNLLFIASFWLSGLSAFYLGYAMTGRTLPAFVGGLVYMFAPYRASQLSHLQVILSPAVPLIFVALHRAAAGGWKWPMAVVLCWTWQGLVTGYYLLFLPLVILVWLLWFAPRDRTLWVRLAIGGLVAAAALAPLLTRYATAHASGGYSREFGEVVALAADVDALWHAAPLLTIWGRVLPAGVPEEQLFPGLTTLLLALVALGGVPRAAGPIGRTTRLLLFLAGAAGAVAVIAFLAPGEHTVAGLRLSLTNPHKQLGVAISLLLIAAMTTPTIREAWSSRSIAAGYALIAIVMWTLALGPMPHLGEVPVWYAAPYRLLFTYVPGFDELRVPARLWMIALAALAALAAVGAARVEARARGRVLLAVCALIVVAEGWLREMPLREAPSPLSIPEQVVAVLEVPSSDPQRDVGAMYRSMSHGRPVINGWSGYVPPGHQRFLERLLAEDASALAEAAALGPIAMIVDPSGPYHERYLRMAAALGSICAPLGKRFVCVIQSR